ncbi:Conserved_hypothetical protein [Hexamita inflata]|uniref:Transmembrane protein n=1 Tax=Hexamita inflata TaxID=28002 RepID=A0AA86QQE9_9EUKA|nr:Conserved hypothetical protein [Hexamita inflata]
MLNLIVIAFHGITTEINTQIEIEDCYSELSRVVLKEDQAQICVQLISAGNSSCKKLPKGVKVSVELDNLSGFYTPTGYFSDFDYSSTTELCVSCLNQACIDNVFYESKTASVVIESYGYKAPVSIGVVVREQQDLVNCIKQSYIKVFSAKIELVAEINDYCWQILTANSYQLLNNTITIRFSGFTFQETYTLASTDIVFTVVGQSFVFSIDESNSYMIFDEYDFIELEMRIGIQQSNTINYLTTSSTKLEIDGLPPGFSQLRLRINPNSMQMAGVPSDVGILYGQMAAGQHFDAFHIKLQIQFGDDAYFFESTDLQTYQNGQTQSFSCSTDQCKTNMLYVYNNIDKITSAGTVSTIKSAGVILYMVTETVTSIYEGCYKGFHLNYNAKYIWFDLLINSASTTCQISTNQTYQLTLSSKNSTLVNITQLTQVLNSTIELINISFVMTKDILAMIQKSTSTFLFIAQNQVTIDYLTLLKVVNADIDSFYNQQLIILGVTMGASIIIATATHLIKLYVKRPVKKTQLKLKDFDEID